MVDPLLLARLMLLHVVFVRAGYAMRPAKVAPLDTRYLASLVSLVQAQSGLSITAAYATLLAGWAQDLISRL